MPQFQNTPPDDLGRSGYRLIRTPANSALLAHVISENLTGCPTHFVGGRTIPCERPTCEACENGVAWRWHAYLAALLDSNAEIVLFETTALAAKAFAAYHERYSTTRGAHFKASRLNGRSNGRVMIQAKPGDLSRIRLPDPIPVEKLLCHIWNISPNQVQQTRQHTRPPLNTAQIDTDAPEITDHPPGVVRFPTPDQTQPAPPPNKPRPDNGNGKHHRQDKRYSQ